MRNLTPPFLLNQVKAGNVHGAFGAVVLFVDTSGFTPLTTQLSTHGRDGAEVLAEILLAVFGPLVETVYAHGGFIAGFAGDAFKAVFSGLTPESYLRAVAAAEAIRHYMTHNHIHETRHGSFDFSVRMSIADGQVTWAVWSGTEHVAAQSRGYTFAGSALDQAIHGEDHADGGELVVTSPVFAMLQAIAALSVTGTPLTGSASGYVRVPQISQPMPDLPSLGSPAQETESVAAVAQQFYPVPLLNMQAQGEFRSVYTLFINVQRLPDPGAEDDFLPRFFQLLHQYGGYLCRIGRIGANDPGGTFLLFWGAPTSHETDLERVLSFILALRAELTIPLRAGITHATVYAGFVGSALREEYTCYGIRVNQAARQMTTAQWDEVLLDAESARHAADMCEIALAGHYSLKGLADQQMLFALHGHRTRAADVVYQGTLVGRQPELAQLHAALAPLLAGRSGGTIFVQGEAGIGKSRLIHAFITAPAVTDHVRVFFGQTDEILRESLNPIRFCVARYFGQSSSVTVAENAAQFARRWQALLAATVEPTQQTELAQARDFFTGLVGLPVASSRYAQLAPQLRFDSTLRAVKTLLLAESRIQPVIVVIEDLQWIDTDSQQCLHRLLQGIEDYPLLVLATSRQAPTDENFAPSTASSTLLKQIITLDALGDDVVRDLVATRLGEPPAPALLAFLAQRGEGNPFFVEQLLLYLQEQSLLTTSTDGVAPKATATVVPDDLHSVLIARLDRLTQAVKELVQAAAVLGREFEVQLLSQMLHEDATLLSKVKIAEEQAIWTPLTELRYLFRHTLLREAAYEMQLRATLRTMHRIAAAAIESLYFHNLESYYADLVYHFRRGEEPTQEHRYALLAGEHAAARYANSDAVAYYSRALELTAAPELQARYDLHLARARLYDLLGERTQQEAEITQLEQLATRLNDDLLRATAALQRADWAMNVSDYATALQAAQATVTLADQDVALAAEGYIKWGQVMIWQGNYQECQTPLNAALRLVQNTNVSQEADAYHQLGFAAMQRRDNHESRSYLERALPIYQAQVDPVQEGFILTITGLTWRNQGDTDQAMRYVQQALSVWREAGFRRGEMIALGNLGNGHLDYGDYWAAQRQYAPAQQIAVELRDQYNIGAGLNNLALVTEHMGDYITAQRHYEEALAIRRRIGAKQGVSLTTRNLGLMLSKMGDHALALRHCTESLTIAQELSSPFDIGMASYKLGRVLFALDRWDEAEEAYTNAYPVLADRPHLAVEVTAGLVELALAHGDVAQQRGAIDELVTYLESRPLGINEPAYVHWICYRALAALGDSRAVRVLTLGYTLIQARSALIQDARLQQIYLHEVAVNRAILNDYHNV